MTLEGGEVPLEQVAAAPRSSWRPTGVQAAIMRKIAADGFISSTDAGVIVHESRGRPCGGYLGGGCCRWASTDGLEAMKRLAAHGVVVRVVAGRWERPPQ